MADCLSTNPSYEGRPNPNVLVHQKSLNAEGKNVGWVGASRKPSSFASEELGFVTQPSLRAASTLSF